MFSGFTALCEKYSMDSRSASGTDKLSRTLNSYLSDIIDNIMGSEGDILKFAGELANDGDHDCKTPCEWIFSHSPIYRMGSQWRSSSKWRKQANNLRERLGSWTRVNELQNRPISRLLDGLKSEVEPQQIWSSHIISHSSWLYQWSFWLKLRFFLIARKFKIVDDVMSTNICELMTEYRKIKQDRVGLNSFNKQFLTHWPNQSQRKLNVALNLQLTFFSESNWLFI